MLRIINYPIALAFCFSALHANPALAGSGTTLPVVVHQGNVHLTLPRVVILATGGTIAGKTTGKGVDSLGYKSGTISPRELLTAVPGLDKKAAISSVQVASIGSQDMNDKIWFDLAEHISEILNTGSTDAIIVTHGTDTMEETAFFLNLVIHRTQPVILTGAMRPATAVGADGPANILEAVNVAVDKKSRNRGVLMVMNDSIQSPVWSTKSDTTGVATFQSPYTGPLGYADAAGVTYTTSTPTAETLQLSLPSDRVLPRVEIIYSHSNMDDVQIRNAVRDGARGIILAGVGDGNTSAVALAALKEARGHGIAVVRASRSYTGAVKRNIEVDDDGAGFVVSPGLNPAKARILTQLLLANHKSSPAEMQAAFNTVTQHEN